MSNKVVLFDLEKNIPATNVLRDIVAHYSTLYLFNCQGQFQYPLEALTELSGWICSGQVIVLDTPTAKQKEFEYAVVVGQLLALLEPDSHIEVVSAMPNCDVLLKMLIEASFSCSLIQIQTESVSAKKSVSKQMPSEQKIQQKPHLQLVKKYCDALAKMTGKPNTIEKLKNSVSNILQVVPAKAQHVVGMLINLRIVKKYDDQIAYRKKVLKQWVELKDDLAVQIEGVSATDALTSPTVGTIQQALSEINVKQPTETSVLESFTAIDPMQLEVIRRLNALKAEKPKDIYALRDFLEQSFPKANVRLLLKELLEKGYIYWNGHDIIYSHEMMLN